MLVALAVNILRLLTQVTWNYWLMDMSSLLSSGFILFLSLHDTPTPLQVAIVCSLTGLLMKCSIIKDYTPWRTVFHSEPLIAIPPKGLLK